MKSLAVALAVREAARADGRCASTTRGSERWLRRSSRPRRRRRASRTGRWSRCPRPPGSAARTRCSRRSARASTREGHPRDLTTLHPIAAGDMYGIKGVDHIAKDGLLATIIAGSYPSGPSSLPMPEIWRMLVEDQVAAYNVPSGILFDMHRDVAARRPGVLTQVGLDTFVDPIREGCAMNAARRGAADRGAGGVRRRDLAALPEHRAGRGDHPRDHGGRARQPDLRARGRLSRRARPGDRGAQPRRAGHRAGEAGDGGGVAAAARRAGAGASGRPGRGRSRAAADHRDALRPGDLRRDHAAVVELHPRRARRREDRRPPRGDGAARRA